MNENDVRYRVGHLEKDVVELKTDVKDIKENHLPHIELKIIEESTEMKVDIAKVATKADLTNKLVVGSGIVVIIVSIIARIMGY